MIKSYNKKGTRLYEVFVKNNNGKQIAKRKRGITSERKAKEIELQLKNEILQISTQDSIWTWARWHTECLQRMQFNRKQSTIINYNGQLKKWLSEDFMNKEISQISRSDIFTEIFENIKNEISEHSRRTLLKRVRRILEMAVEEGLIPSNPSKSLSVKLPQQVQKVLTSEEAQVFLAAAQDTNHRFYPIWAFALMTGMRSGEMYALKWSDIDLEAGNISVTKQWTSKDGFTSTKTGESRIVPISKELKYFLTERKLKSFGQEFVLPHLKEWEHGDQAKVTREFCKTIGVTVVKFHDLRATFITNMLSQGVPLVTVMAIVGHKRMSTTDIYLRLAGVNVKNATDNLGYCLPPRHEDNLLEFRKNHS